MSNLFETVTKGATISSCETYRYQLWREWDASLPRVLFIMLNPSTADAARDDPTIRKCIAYARAWGHGSLEVVNLFAVRSTSPALIYTHADPIGRSNDPLILESAYRSQLIVAAWGTHGEHRARDRHVGALLSLHGFKLHCLKVTDKGLPNHPLYLKGDLRPMPFVVANEARLNRRAVPPPAKAGGLPAAVET
jgi:hypothetical protein